MDHIEDRDRSRLIERFGRSYKAGQHIYAEGDDARSCFLLRQGEVRLFRHIRGEEVNLALLPTGGLFGEEALGPHHRRRSHAQATSEVTAIELDRETYNALLAGHADVAGRLNEQLVQRIELLQDQLASVMCDDPTMRVVSALLKETRGQSSEGRQVEVALSPIELASKVALNLRQTRENLERLANGGYISIRGETTLRIVDVARLDSLARLLEMQERVRSGLS